MLQGAGQPQPFETRPGDMLVMQLRKFVGCHHASSSWPLSFASWHMVWMSIVRRQHTVGPWKATGKRLNCRPTAQPLVRTWRRDPKHAELADPSTQSVDVGA
ncbi:hypothetical protein CUC08_Gglean010030 [Alternaria sp. MG1]|nr:hypothetical protein CUC08_Gglean010030 [Alternaria sp. MG1]